MKTLKDILYSKALVLLLIAVLVLIFYLVIREKDNRESGEGFDFIHNIEQASVQLNLPQRVEYSAETNPEILVGGGFIPSFINPRGNTDVIMEKSSSVFRNGFFLIPLSSLESKSGLQLTFRTENSQNKNHMILEFKNTLSITLEHLNDGKKDSRVWSFSKSEIKYPAGNIYIFYYENHFLVLNNNKVLIYLPDLAVSHQESRKYLNSQFNGNNTLRSINGSHRHLTYSREKLLIKLIDSCGLSNGYLSGDLNSYQPEHEIVINGKKYPFLQRVKLKGNTIRSLIVPINSEFSWETEIPPDSFLKYSIHFHQRNSVLRDKLRARVKVLSLKNKKEKVFDVPVNQNEKGWKRLKIPMDQFSGEMCKITFTTFSPNAGRFEYVLWGNPVIVSRREQSAKNIILISLDSVRPDHLGCYGYNRDTSPVIDEIAAHGAIFKNAISASPWTLPSHMSILSSKYPSEAGFFQAREGTTPRLVPGHYLNYCRMQSEDPALAEILKANNYRTAAFTGGIFVSPVFFMDRGFEEFYESRIAKNEMGLIDVKDDLENVRKWLKENSDEKFFIFFHTYETHFPNTREIFKTKNKGNLKDSIISRYDSGIRYTDEALKTVLTFLKQKNLMHDTLIIITSDHGENFSPLAIKYGKNKSGFHGMSMYDSELKVPLIIGGIEGRIKGKSIDEQVRTIDIMPTILELAGIPVDSNLRGKSLALYMNSKEPEQKEVLAFSEATFIRKNISEKKSLRTSNYKLVKNLGTDEEKKMDSYEPYELYNLKDDSGETRNIVSREKDIFTTLRVQLNKMIAYLKKMQADNFSGKNIKKELESDLKRQLKTLGYLD